MKIDSNPANASKPTDQRAREVEAERQNAASESKEARSAKTDDKVQLSAEARSLDRLRAAVDAADGFDAARVDDIRKAISEGRYHVDADRLAEAFVDLENKLNQ